MADFNVNLRGVGSVSVIDVKGYLDAHTAPELENMFSKLITDKQFKVVVNFDQLNYKLELNWNLDYHLFQHKIVAVHLYQQLMHKTLLYLEKN